MERLTGPCWVAAALLLLVAGARAGEPDSFGCQTGHWSDAKAWIAACDAAIAAAAPSDAEGLSDDYADRAFADINLALNSDRDFSKAIADTTEALRLNPDNFAASLNRANAWWYSGDTGKALADIDLTLKLNPGIYQPYTLRCEILTKLGRAHEVLPDCLRAIELGGPVYDVLAAARAFEAAGDIPGAIAQYRLAQRMNPSPSEMEKIKSALDRLGADAL